MGRRNATASRREILIHMTDVSSDEGGDPACWAHLFEEPEDEPAQADADKEADQPS